MNGAPPCKGGPNHGSAHRSLGARSGLPPPMLLHPGPGFTYTSGGLAQALRSHPRASNEGIPCLFVHRAQDARSWLHLAAPYRGWWYPYIRRVWSGYTPWTVVTVPVNGKPPSGELRRTDPQLFSTSAIVWRRGSPLTYRTPLRTLRRPSARLTCGVNPERTSEPLKRRGPDIPKWIACLSIWG